MSLDKSREKPQVVHQNRHRISLKSMVIGGSFGLIVLAITDFTSASITHFLFGDKSSEIEPDSPDYSLSSKNQAAQTFEEKPHLERVIPEGILIPENERTGSNILLSINPQYMGARCFDVSSKDAGKWMPILRALPAGTHVRLVVPIEADELCREELEKSFPNLQFFLYKLQIASAAFVERSSFMQDIVFATGSRDADGRFNIIGNILDPELLEIRGAVDVNRAGGQIRIKDGQEAIGMRLLGDEFLAQDYPEAFKMFQVPLYAEGGDMQITKIRGKTVLIVGPALIATNVMAGKYILDKSSIGNMNNPIPAEEFISMYTIITKAYRDMFGVDDVLDLGKTKLFAWLARHGSIKIGDLILGSAFFHSDMIVKSATDPKNPNNTLAFCTHAINDSGAVPKTNMYEGDQQYLDSSQRQLQDAGFEIVQLPCGPWPVLNYTNSTMFARNGQKIVMVPQYGIPEDSMALKIYEDRGFVTVKVDMSYLKGTGKEPVRDTGSLHCRLVVLN